MLVEALVRLSSALVCPLANHLTQKRVIGGGPIISSLVMISADTIPSRLSLN